MAITHHNLTDEVIGRMANCPNPRLKEIMNSLVKHLHAFAQEVHLTEAEWMTGVQFLTRTGQMCDERRQEFILLSDTLGLSMLVDGINHPSGGEATENTVLGPFYVDGAPAMPLGSKLTEDLGRGDAIWVDCRVVDGQGKPVAGARVDVWHSSPEGLYDLQYVDTDAMDLRGTFHTDADGRVYFRTTKPVPYPVPDDGPIGDMLEALGRHPWRPAHLHFIIRKDGFETVTTHLFNDDSQYLDSDVVFGVKDSLIVHYERNDSKEEAERLGVPSPFWTLGYEFTLKPVGAPVR